MKSLQKVAQSFSGFLPAVFALGLVLVLGEVAMAQAQNDLIPDLDTPVQEYITEGITKMAVVVGVAVGGWFAFKIVRKGLSWASRAF